MVSLIIIAAISGFIGGTATGLWWMIWGQEHSVEQFEVPEWIREG